MAWAGRVLQTKKDVAIYAGEFNPNEDGQLPNLSEYDVLNRTLNVTLPDKAVTETVYGFESDKNGMQQFSTKTTDANGKQTEQFTDVRGRVTAVKNYTTEKAVWTSFYPFCFTRLRKAIFKLFLNMIELGFNICVDQK